MFLNALLHVMLSKCRVPPYLMAHQLLLYRMLVSLFSSKRKSGIVPQIISEPTGSYEGYLSNEIRTL